MHKELEVMKPRCNGLWKRGAGTAALIYFWILTNVPVAALAKSEKGKSDATDTGVTEVTDGINVIKDLVLDVLNFNKNGRKFTAEDIADYDLSIQQAIIKAYTSFINEVMGNPN